MSLSARTFDAIPRPSFSALRTITGLLLAMVILAPSSSALQVALTWADNASNESGNTIERATGTGNYTQIATTAANTVSYVDTSVVASASYKYRVRAYNTMGNSAYSNIASVATGAVSPANTAPTISAIANRTINVGTNTGAIAFTIGDPETTATSLTLTRSSSNTTLVATSGIVLGGSAANRTVTVTPVAGQSGSATITVTVSDGALSTSDTFVLTVNAVATGANTAPTISSLANRTINEDATTGAIAITIGDAQTAASSLTVTRGSSNLTLVPTANIALGGSGANRTVNVTPAANQSGSATITVTVSDGNLTASRSFALTVTAVNDVPTIGSIPNQSIQSATKAGPISFTIGDVETSAGSLTLSGSSSNTTLVPTAGITFGGSGATRTVTVVPVATANGTATISVRVSDGATTSTRTFTLNVTTNTPVPNPALTSGDIGSPARAGSMTTTNGSIQIRAAGRDIWGTSDQFHFARQQLTGDAEMIVRVASLQNTNSWAKAGLMFRASLAANAAYVGVFVTPAQRIILQWRTQTGATTQFSSVLTGAAPEWLRLTRSGNMVYAFRSEDGIDWELVEFAPVTLPSQAYGGLAVTSHNAFTTTTATFDSFAVDAVTTPVAAPVASPTLTSADIGSPARAGSMTSNNGTIQIRAAGTDIWGTADQFHFASQQMTGDAEMIVRVASLQNTNSWAKAGLMFRASTAANAAYVGVFITPAQRVVLQWRTQTGASAQSSATLYGAAPEWLRLTRTGNMVYAFRSENGIDWELVEFAQVTLPSVAHGGLAVTSHNAFTTTTATFDSFVVD